MTRKRSHSPDSPHLLAHVPRATDSTHSPRPLCNRGGRAGVSVSTYATLPARGGGPWLT
jgi:hypothetical protein